MSLYQVVGSPRARGLPQDSEPFVHLKQPFVLSQHPTLKAEPYAFQVNTLQRSYYLCAESEREMDYWITQLVRYIKEKGIEERVNKQIEASNPEKCKIIFPTFH